MWNFGDGGGGDDVAGVPGYEGAVLGREGSETEVVEVSLQVHDVVPEARGTEDDQRRVWAGDDVFVFMYPHCFH